MGKKSYTLLYSICLRRVNLFEIITNEIEPHLSLYNSQYDSVRLWQIISQHESVYHNSALEHKNVCNPHCHQHIESKLSTSYHRIAKISAFRYDAICFASDLLGLSKIVIVTL